MNRFRRLSFDMWYLHRPPWESGIVPPEVAEYIATHPPGFALDLGCGSGTSSLALAQAGWTVCGVDFAARAIRMARQKARLSRLKVDFYRCDVVHLPSSILLTSFDLVLDIGCFHGLRPLERDTYLDGLDRLVAPGGCWLLYGFYLSGETPLHGSTGGEQCDHGKRLTLAWRRNGMDKKGRPSAWFCYRV